MGKEVRDMQTLTCRPKRGLAENRRTNWLRDAPGLGSHRAGLAGVGGKVEDSWVRTH